MNRTQSCGAPTGNLNSLYSKESAHVRQEWCSSHLKPIDRGSRKSPMKIKIGSACMKGKDQHSTGHMRHPCWPASCVYLSRKERELESNGRNGRGGWKSRNNCHWAGQQCHIELIWDKGQRFHSDMKWKFKSKTHGKIGEWNFGILCTYEEEQLCKCHCWAQWVKYNIFMFEPHELKDHIMN